ncbi:hypothetical protein HAV15_011946 [Penicillium sp. str. |nr:hypothetical protein HAV15_011946 [Penicillium sp. str. \
MICPASRNNVVGIKTTSGLVARDNVIVTKMRGSIGPFAKTIRDAAIALSVMAGKSPEDPTSQEIPFESIPDYEKACRLADFRSIRLAIPQNAFQNPFVQSMNLSAIKKDFEIVISSFRAHGATIIDDANYSSYDRINGPSAPQQYVGPAEYKSDMAHYFRGLEINPFNIQNIEDTISCTKSIPAEDYPSRDISYWDTVRKAEDVLSEKVVAGIKEMRYLGGAAGIDQVLDASGADATILPSIICADVPGLVGYPIITVPMGFSPSDTPVTLSERGNLVWDGPNIP